MLELRQVLDVAALSWPRVVAPRTTRPGSNSSSPTATVSFAGSDTGVAVDADVALHRGIVEASHNSVYLEFYDSLLRSIRRTINRHVGVTGLAFEPEHTALVIAVIDGDEGGNRAGGTSPFRGARRPRLRTRPAFG